jgi:hypothetical protein
MNDNKLNQLFSATGREKPAAPTDGFELLVLQQIQRNPARTELTISDVLGMWFPRLALVAATVIALCVVGDFVSSSNSPSLSDSTSQLSDQMLVEN